METKEKTTELATMPKKIMEVAIRLNQSVCNVIGQESVQGFEKAYLVANAIAELKEMLTPEYMKPIMNLQGNKLGFKTDKDKEKGYAEDVVKNCLIEAVLIGLQPTGNQFNIIAGNMYATKEGCGYLLSKIHGLQYDIIPELPRIKDGSAAVVMGIEWTLGGVTKFKKIDIPIKVNNYMGTDAVLGKATRKARKWLYDTITGTEIPEGEAGEVTIITSSVPETANKENLKFNDVEVVDEKQAEKPKDETFPANTDFQKETPKAKANTKTAEKVSTTTNANEKPDGKIKF